SEIGGFDRETHPGEFVEEFSVDEMDLAQIGLCGVGFDSRSMLDCLAIMGVAANAEVGNNLDLGNELFRKPVLGIPGHRDDPRMHRLTHLTPPSAPIAPLPRARAGGCARARSAHNRRA